LSSKQQIGLHLRLQTTLMNLVSQAHECNVTSFQFFLVVQKTQKYVRFSSKDKEEFLKVRSSFSDLYIHSSYWINPASCRKDVFDLSKRLLKKEIATAKALDIGYLVLHGGSAKGYPVWQDDPEGKKRGITTLASMLNSILKNEEGIQILLENGAHGKGTIGSNFEDYKVLLEYLDYPEKVRFCFDTAHAFSFGYELEPIDDFISMLQNNIKLEHIKLIHFNDTHDKQSSMQDRHAFPGQGKIGKQLLTNFLNHPKLKKIPKIVEGPDAEPSVTKEVLEEILSWSK